jgi:hypothetical protein
MIKKNKAAVVIELLGQGYSAQEIKNRMAVSASYVYMIKKQLAEGVEEAAITEAEDKMSSDFLESLSQGKGKPKPEPEVSGVGKVLDARAEQYGSFMQSADTVVRIKSIMHNAVARNNVHLYPDQLQALDMIATKISRIVHGNPNHLDSWIDIAGYATLVADRIQGKVR